MKIYKRDTSPKVAIDEEVSILGIYSDNLVRLLDESKVLNSRIADITKKVQRLIKNKDYI